MGKAGANITKEVISKCGRTLQPLVDLTGNFSSRERSHVHSKASAALDIKVAVNCLVANGVFTDKGKDIDGYEPIKTKLKPLNHKNFVDWLTKILEVDVSCTFDSS